MTPSASPTTRYTDLTQATISGGASVEVDVGVVSVRTSESLVVGECRGVGDGAMHLVCCEKSASGSVLAVTY